MSAGRLVGARLVGGRLVGARLVGGLRWFPMAILAVALCLAVVGPAAAASPSPSDSIGGDPRSPGQGPGLVGDPVVAILLVVAIGLLALGLTLLWVKLTGGRRT